MAARRRRYVAHGRLGGNWHIHDTKTNTDWGKPFGSYPAELLDELNGQKRQDELTRLEAKIRKGEKVRQVQVVSSSKKRKKK